MKLIESQMAAVRRPGVVKLANIFANHGHEIRIAGGAVRDILSNKVPQDLDFATTATPEQMKSMFEAEGIRMINLTGVKHGTVTVRFEEENFECTTLRIDAVTDGRHAEVQFTQDWKLDANRRDLTINAMFLDLDGTVYDYFEGTKHIQEKFVTFVGSPDERIKEDYLRILRYFRFYGRVADSPDNHDPNILESIKANVEGLAKISGERIWVEMKKIVTGNFASDLITKMVECGVTPYIGLPDNFDTGNLQALCKRWEELSIKDMHHMTILAAGFLNEEQCLKLVSRVKCSNKETDVLLRIVRDRDFAVQVTSLKEIKDYLAESIIGERRNNEIARFYTSELLKYSCKVEYQDEIREWNMPKFPVNGHMIGEKGINRKKTRQALSDLLQEWKKSDFTLSTEELLGRLDIAKYQDATSDGK